MTDQTHYYYQVVTYQGVMSDHIEIRVTDHRLGAKVTSWGLPNKLGSWVLLHGISEDPAVEMVVTRIDWDNNETHTPWLESLPYLHRAKQIADAA